MANAQHLGGSRRWRYCKTACVCRWAARGDKFEGRFTQIISDIQMQADDDELSGGAVVQPAYSIPQRDSTRASKNRRP
jgi:hypothetical protein